MIVEAAPSALVLVDEAGTMLLANREATRLFGYEPDELTAKPLSLLVPPRWREVHPAHRERYLRDPQARPMGAGRDLYGLRKDGTEFPVEIGLNPVDANGKRLVLSAIVDLTERRKAQVRFRAAVEASPTAMLMTGAEGAIVLANTRAHQLFGYPPGALLGRTVDALVPLRFRGGHLAHRRSYTEAPATRPMGPGRELFGLKSDGSEFPVEIGLNPISTSEGSFVLCSVVDVTERKRAEEARALHELERSRQHAELLKAKQAQEQTMAELQRRNAQLDEFAQIASHDLRSPLRGIASLAKMLSEDLGTRLEGEEADWLHLIGERVNRLDRLLVDLLAYSRAARTESDDTPRPLRALVEEELDLRSAPEGFVLERGDLPGEVRDGVAFSTVLRNLLDNALKHHGSQTGRVRVEQRPAEAGFVAVAVVDDGVGVAPEHVERIFEPFTTVQAGVGSGVGLALVRRLVESRGGRVSAEATAGGGATFLFSWPGASTC